MKLIKYEESNPEKVDAVRLRVRVRHAYIHALSCLQFYPDMWFAFAASEKLMNDVSSSMAILDRALYLLPESLLLHFTRADLLESLGRTKEAKERYEALLVDEKNASSLTYIQFMKFLRRTEGEKAARTLFLRARKVRCLFVLSRSLLLFLLAKEACAEIEYIVRESDQRSVYRFGVDGVQGEPERQGCAESVRDGHESLRQRPHLRTRVSPVYIHDQPAQRCHRSIRAVS